MIPQETIERIIDAARIEEVVGEFVTLKKRGVSLLGLCPFHNERTPSFNVSTVKGIYKCFGCGKAGNAVNFIMEHEHFSYPEALRYLAHKYNIEIEEEKPSPEVLAAKDERESLYIVSAYAQKYFTETLHEHTEGKAIGLTYFKERGFTAETIEKFQLGYSLGEWNGFTDNALKNGYKQEYLVKTGLSIENESRVYDRFRGRVMFPIHNLSGRVIGYGGRVLKLDPKSPKYLNSPESEIYHKSQVLYGIYFAKKAIAAEDTCYLVEGYTDVISMHQCGVENVVASSGTSLTVEQIRLIGRYTKNVTVLYDGDAAGIKASLRGIDLILEEGLNVRVLLFPDGDDPDSFSKKVTSAELKAFIKSNAKDFILFKTQLLLADTANDPIKKAELIRDIVESIARIPDPIMRATYTKECSNLLDIGEQVLLTELNKLRRKDIKKQEETAATESPTSLVLKEESRPEISYSCEAQERDIVRLLVTYGNHDLLFTDTTDEKAPEDFTVKVADFILSELEKDKGFLDFENPLYVHIQQQFIDNNQSESPLAPSFFINHPERNIAQLAAELISSAYELSENWREMHEIFVTTEESILKEAVMSSLYALRMRKLIKLIHENQQQLKSCSDDDELMALLQKQQQFDIIKGQLSKELGIVVIK